MTKLIHEASGMPSATHRSVLMMYGFLIVLVLTIYATIESSFIFSRDQAVQSSWEMISPVGLKGLDL